MNNSVTPGGFDRPAPTPFQDPAVSQLRDRVLSELASVKGRVELALETKDTARAKEQLRIAHSAQREARFKDSAEWIIKHEPALLDQFANGDEIEPHLIEPFVIPVRMQHDADLFRYATLQWSVPVSAGYGRRNRFLVRDRQNGKLIAIFALGDPVIAQGARDSAIGWDKANRNAKLYNVYDAFVLGAVEPYRQLLAGKLAALLTLSNEVRDFLTNKYTGTTTGISKVQKDPTPVLITTSSALGRSSVYNRITLDGKLMFHSVGFTKGFGHFQFSDAVFADLLDFVRHTVLDDPGTKVGSAAYGSGPNWRFRVIRTALQALDIDPGYLQHNVKREVFLAPTAIGWDAYLRGEQDGFEPYDLPVDRIGQYFRERWAIGRGERMPGYKYWRREEGRLSPHLGERQLMIGVSSNPAFGRVDLGSYSLAIGTDKRRVRGRTASGKTTDGIAYLSRLEGPELNLEFADIQWDSGERDVRGVGPGDSGALRVRIEPSSTFRNMSVAELRIAKTKLGGGSPTYSKVSNESLSELVGFDVKDALDEVSEATVGTRESVLGDDGSSRRQLCVVFSANDHTTPALAWALTRPLSVLLTSDGEVAIPAWPKMRRSPPAVDKMDFDDSATHPA